MARGKRVSLKPSEGLKCIRAKSPRARLDDREIFLIVHAKYANRSLPLPQREAMKRLRQMALYKDYSDRQLRRLLEKALNDPRSDQFLKVDLKPPIDWEMGRAIQSLLPGVREVIVTPFAGEFDTKASFKFLGTVAANIFGHRLIGGQAIGLGTGNAVRAFASSLQLEACIVANLKLFALLYRNASDGETGAEALMEILARCASLSVPQSVEGVVAPETLGPDDLDWAFIEFEPLRDERLKGKGFVAKVVGHLLSKEGSLVALTDGSTFSPSSLQQMVQLGKGVVAFANGPESADSLLAEFRMRQIGKPLFNFLVTDDACANRFLSLLGYRTSDVPRRHDWWLKKCTFLAAFNRYFTASRRTVADIAKSLSLSVKQVRRLLENAAHGSANDEPMLSFQVLAPSPELALEASLLRDWSLMEVRVTPTFEDKDEGIRFLGNTGASLLISLLTGREEYTVGFGGGRAVRAIIEALNLKHLFQDFPSLKKLRICALERNPLPKVFGVTAETILAPLLTSFVDDRGKLEFCRYNSAKDEPNLDAVFLSIASLKPPDSVYAFLHQEEGFLKDELVGMMLFQFITRDGRVLPTRWARELEFMPLLKLRKMCEEGKPVVLVARGSHKADAIFAAYQMGLFNCLIIDRVLAEALLTYTRRKAGGVC